MEHLVLAHLKSITDSALDPLQFAYKANRSTEDPVNMAVHYVLKHLDTAANYARILCVDFSLAFNTILPSTLETQLSLLQVPAPTRRWVMDILTNRSQRVNLGKYISSSRFTSIGSPAVLPVHQQLYLSPHISQAPEVCGRHHPGWPHLRGGRVCI